MKNLALLFFLLPLLVIGQEDQGTHFEHGLSWAQVKEKAKKENKYLFVDCFTTWCAPCMHMTNKVFPQPKVGQFFNQNFVNVKVQHDRTDRDSEEVKSWYADADAIAKTYQVRAYPTFLIFSPDGELVHRIVGGGEADDFIAKAEKGLRPETQYYTLLNRYHGGEKSPEFLKNLAYVAMEAYDEQLAAQLVEEFLDTQADLYTKENLEFLAQHTHDSKSKGFTIMMNDGDKIDAILGAGFAAKKLNRIVMQEAVYANISQDYQLNLDSIKSVVAAAYPQLDLVEPLALLNVQLLQARADWPAFQTALIDYMATYGSNVDAYQLNAFAWSVFEHCDDPSCVAEAISWSKRNVEGTGGQTPAFIDTYANLLYKSGDTQQAIEWLQKAVDLADAEKKGDYLATLEKFKKGEKTW